MQALDGIEAIQAKGSGALEQKLRRLRQAAGEAVGSTFYGTIFEMMRNSPFKTKIGHGGRGEEVFAGQLHGLLAERMGQAKGMNISEVLYRRLEKQQQLIDGRREIPRFGQNDDGEILRFAQNGMGKVIGGDE